jgi:AcrR family transcriptional regulator
VDKPVSGAEITRIALLDAAIRLFGEHGYDAVSTRAIADLAAANIGSIAYHFGGKPGLRLACADHVISLIKAVIGINLKRRLPPMAPQAAEAQIIDVMAKFCRFWITNPDMRHAIVFMTREALDPGEVSELIYVNWMKPMHQQLCALFSDATGLDPDSETVKIVIFSMIGQAFNFRIGLPLMMRRLEWDTMGEDESERLCNQLVAQVRLMIQIHRASASAAAAAA